MNQWLNEIGLVLGLAGAWTLASILLIGRKQAIELGVSRWSGDTEDQQLKLPMVRMFLEQRRRTLAGMVLVTLSGLLQILANWPQG